MAVASHSLQLLGLSRPFPSNALCYDTRWGFRGRVSCISLDSGSGVALCVDDVPGSSSAGSSSLANRLRQLNLEFDSEKVTIKQDPGLPSSDIGSLSSGKRISSSRMTRSGSGSVVDRWRPGQESTEPNGSPVDVGRLWGLGDRPKHVTAEEVPLVLTRLSCMEETEAGVALAMEGWEAPLSARSLVSILNSLDRWQKALPFFRWAESREYDLNVYTFNVMLKLLRKGRQWDLAERLVLEMSKKGVEPDNISYSTLISCASRCNRHEEALTWYEKMHKAGCVPDAVTYGSVMDMYGRAGRVNDALALYGQLREKGWKPDAVNFGSILNMFANVGRFKEAEKTFEELKKSGVKPTAVVYNIMIRVLGGMGRTDEATKVLEEMIRAGIKPTAITISSMVEAYGKSGKFQECLDIYHRMQQEGWGCDEIVHNTVLKQCADFGSEEQAESIFEKMQMLGIMPADYTYKIMLHMYSKRGSKLKAEKLFARMVKSGVPADVVSYTSLMQTYGHAKDFVKVTKSFNDMVGSGFKPDEKLWGSLFSLLVLCENDEQRQILIGIFEKGNPELHRILSKLVSPEIQEQQMHQELQSLTQNFSAGAYRRYVNSIIDFCEAKKVEGRAMQILMLSINLGIFPDVQSRAPAVWRLHLRPFSVGVTRCLVKWWINTLSEAVDGDLELPKAVVIELGTGKGRWIDTEQKKKDLVLSYLTERNSPFTEKSTSEDGREPLTFLLASGDAVQSWLCGEESSRAVSV